MFGRFLGHDNIVAWWAWVAEYYVMGISPLQVPGLDIGPANLSDATITPKHHEPQASHVTKCGINAIVKIDLEQAYLPRETQPNKNGEINHICSHSTTETTKYSPAINSNP